MTAYMKLHVIRIFDYSNFSHSLTEQVRQNAKQIAILFQRILRLGHAQQLHPRNDRDSVIIYSIHHHTSVMDTNQILNDTPLAGIEINKAIESI